VQPNETEKEERQSGFNTPNRRISPSHPSFPDADADKESLDIDAFLSHTDLY